MSPRIRILALAASCIAAASALTGCSGRNVPMDAAPNANDPACADVIVRLPDTVAGLERRFTNAQSTGAWGDPASVLLYCGIEPSGPTTDRCVNVNGVDWIIDESQAPLFRLEAYGRQPGLQIIVDGEQASGTDAVLDLGSAVQQLPQERKCVGPSDSFEF